MSVNVVSVAVALVLVGFTLSISRFASVQRRAASYAPPGQTRARQRGLGWMFVVVGTIGLITNGVLFTTADADLRVYNGSSSCRAGLVLAQALDGACTVESAVIQDAYRTSGKGAATHIVLAFADGHTENVIEQQILRGGVLAGFRNANDRAATTQRFRGRTVLVQTDSGSFETLNMPVQRVNEFGLFGIFFGVIGFIGAVLLALR